MLSSETQSPLKVRTLQQTVKSVAQGLEAVRTGSTDAEVSKFPLAKSLNNYAVIVDGRTTFATVRTIGFLGPDMLQSFMKFQL
jgi:hypothetical protein